MTSTNDASPQVEALKAVVSDILNSPVLEKFVSVWQEMGVENENLVTRRDTIRLHIHNLMEDMYNEEVVLKDKLIESVAQCTQELAELCSQLSVPFHGPSESLPLAAKEKELRQKADTLTKEKHNRLKRLKRLTELEVAMCRCLGEQPQLGSVMQSGIVPSEDELQNYRGRIGRLEQKKNDRQAEFCSVREKVMKLWAELEVEPHKEFEVQVAGGDIKKFHLTQDNMSLLHTLFKELEEEATHLESRALQLRESIHSLWERLEVPQEDRDAFTQLHTGHKPKTIAALCNEMSRLNELKKEHMQKFCERTRAELHLVWDQCMYGPNQRQEFSPAFSDNFSEDLLSAHESELDRMRGFYRDNKDVFEMVQKRDKLRQQQIALDKQSQDPNRFNNRGGQLQKQLKQRKQLEKELPKLEKELTASLLQWEEDHQRYFIVQDSRYLDALELEVKERLSTKEKEKIKKKRDKEETLMFEMTYGSKPCTPVKRRGATTPVSGNECKQRRVGPSPLRPTARPHPKKPETGSNPRKRPAGLPTPHRKKAAVTLNRKALVEKNCGPNPDESVFSLVNTSLASAGSYTDFQRELQVGIDSQKSARSSAIPKSSSAHNLANK